MPFWEKGKLKKEWRKYVPDFECSSVREKKIKEGTLKTILCRWKGGWATVWKVKNKEGKVVRKGIKYGVGSMARIGKTARIGLEEHLEKLLEDL